MRILILILACITTPAAGQTPRAIGVGDAPVEGVVSPGKPQAYTLTVGARHLVRGVAQQLTADVVVRILDPSGRVMGTFDGPARGPETFRFTTALAGEHRIEISAFESDSGAYALRLDRVEPVATDPAARVDQVMSDYDDTSPGGVIAVVRDGRIVFVRGYGMANLEYDVPHGPETVFHMASVSKQFTAFAILLLAEQGRLSLDDDIREHLPELHAFGTPITIRHLIHHTSGLRDQWTLWAMAGGRLDDVITQNDLLALIRRQTELNFAPGSEHLYSNTGYTLLAEIVERVSGEPFGAWMKRTVFEPLGMTRTQIYDDHQRVVKGRAYSYQRNREGAWAKSVLSYANRGATSLFTTAGDLALWLQNFRTGQVGGPAVIEAMKQRGRLTSGDSIAYAFGIGHLQQRGLNMLLHGGADAGYRTMLMYLPDLNAGVIALGNDASFDSGAVTREVLEAFFGDRMTPLPPDTQRQAPQSPPQPQWSPSPQEMEASTGVYYSPELETRYTVVVQDGRLIARHRRHGDLALRPVSPDRFTAPAWYFSNVHFERSADDIITGMRVTSGRVRNLRFERLP
jgi:CubicO group peptidase (beta-lactamase class C family)